MDIAAFAGQILNSSDPVDLSNMEPPIGCNVLVLGPHSDDFDAVGVTMRWLFRARCNIFVVTIHLDTGVDEDYQPETPQAEIRRREQLASLDFFALGEDKNPPHVEFPLLDCDETGRLTNSQANIDFIIKILNSHKPDIVYLPHGNDTNTTHQVVAEMLTEARRSCQHKFLVMFNHDPKTQQMAPNAFIPFDDKLADWKAQLLRCHDSQHQRNLRTRNAGFDDRILDDNRNSAKSISTSLPFGEIFECVF